MSLVLVCLILFLFNTCKYLFYYLVVFFFRDINNILFMSHFFFWLNKISWNNHRVLFEFLNDKHVVIEYSLHHISRSYDILSCKRAVLTAIIVKRSLNCTIMKIILFSFVNSISFRELDRPPSVCLST